MATIPLEDSSADILGKTQRGLRLTDAELATRAGVSLTDLAQAKSGFVDPPALLKLAGALNLGPDALVASAQKCWYPQTVQLEGLAQFNTVYEDMTVNSYLAWDPVSRQAAVFDTGTTVEPILEFAQERGLNIQLILLTHTHPDHIADLARLTSETGAATFVGQLEAIEGAVGFAAGREFKIGSLRVETRQTSGHSVGGITYVIHGLAQPVAVVGDSIFAGSMGGGAISFSDALANNRRHILSLPEETILCPGHGPLTTVGEQKRHNPFFPEFQSQPKTKKTMTERVGFVGVGRMGANMARRLKECGYRVSAIYDVRASSAQKLAQELGCEAAASLARVTALSDVVITVVTDDKAMQHIFGNTKDNLLIGAKGKLFINCATISPQTHVWAQQLARRKQATALEACMASSITQARNGTLYLMIGGEKSTFEKAKGILTPLSDDGKLLRYVGKAGQAAVVKALVNMVMNINTAGLAEGLALGKAYGIDLKMLMEVFSQTGANSRVLQTDGEDMVNRDHACFFSASHAAKDSGIALKLSLAKKMKLPLAAAAKAQYDRMVKSNLGELDKSGIAELTFPGRLKKKK